MLEISLADDPASPTLEVGIGETYGFLRYMSADDDTLTAGDIATTDYVAYD
jgi:hypothetical protein